MDLDFQDPTFFLGRFSLFRLTIAATDLSLGAKTIFPSLIVSLPLCYPACCPYFQDIPPGHSHFLPYPYHTNVGAWYQAWNLFQRTSLTAWPRFSKLIIWFVSAMDLHVVPICYPNMETFQTLLAKSSLFSHPSLCKTHLILSIGHFQQRGLKSGRGGERMERKGKHRGEGMKGEGGTLLL